MKKCKESGYYLLEETEVTKSDIPVQPEGTMLEFLKESGIAGLSTTDSDHGVVKEDLVINRTYFKILGKICNESSPQLNNFVFDRVQLRIRLGKISVINVESKSILPAITYDFIMHNDRLGMKKIEDKDKISKEEYVKMLEDVLGILDKFQLNFFTTSILLSDEKV